MNRVRNFPPSPAFADMALTLATQIADLECHPDQSDEAIASLINGFSATEKTLLRKPVECVGDLLMKIEILAKIAEHSAVDDEEWQALARDAVSLNGPGMSFSPEAWLRRWTNRGGGYVRTDSGVTFLATGSMPGQQRLLLDELERAQGHRAVAAVIDGVDEPQPPSWETARAAFDAKSAEIDATVASDEQLDEYWRLWDDAMLCPSDTAEAAKWKIGQFAYWTSECGKFTDDAAEKYTAAIFADVARHARKGGAA